MHFSAKRFDEYLSLGQVPRQPAGETGAPVLPRDEALAAVAAPEPSDDPDTAVPPEGLVRGNTYFDIFSPQNRDYTLTVVPLPLDRDVPTTGADAPTRPLPSRCRFLQAI